MFLGLRTVIYPAPDLAATKAAFVTALGIEPYFDEPFYVGFELAGYELGLDPNADAAYGPVVFWGVEDCAAAARTMQDRGATVVGAPNEVGDGITVATVELPGGHRLGLITNPHFRAENP